MRPSEAASILRATSSRLQTLIRCATAPVAHALERVGYCLIFEADIGHGRLEHWWCNAERRRIVYMAGAGKNGQ
jgi:hypothetical protein